VAANIEELMPGGLLMRCREFFRRSAGELRQPSKIKSEILKSHWEDLLKGKIGNVNVGRFLANVG